MNKKNTFMITLCGYMHAKVNYGTVIRGA